MLPIIGALQAASSTWDSIKSFFGDLIRGRTQHATYEQADSKAHEQLETIRGVWRGSLSASEFEQLSRLYLPKLRAFMTPTPAGAGVMFDWWNPQSLLANVEQYEQTTVGDTAWNRIGAALYCHLLWIIKNVDVERGFSDVDAIFYAHLRIMQLDTITSNQGGGSGSGTPENTPQTEQKKTTSTLLLAGGAGLAMWFLLGTPSKQ